MIMMLLVGLTFSRGVGAGCAGTGTASPSRRYSALYRTSPYTLIFGILVFSTIDRTMLSSSFVGGNDMVKVYNRNSGSNSNRRA
jgi:hypothetical protein